MILRVFENEKEQQEQAANNAYDQCFKKFCSGWFLIHGIVSATEKMKGYPASRVQELAKVKAGWYAEIVPIDLHTQVIKA